jgi:putative endonuclease
VAPCVYVLKSSKNGRYYIGSTKDFERRIKEHLAGKTKYTHDSGSYERVFIQYFDTLIEARRLERWLKAQKSRKLIDEVIATGQIRKKL